MIVCLCSLYEYILYIIYRVYIVSKEFVIYCIRTLYIRIIVILLNEVNINLTQRIMYSQ